MGSAAFSRSSTSDVIASLLERSVRGASAALWRKGGGRRRGHTSRAVSCGEARFANVSGAVVNTDIPAPQVSVVIVHYETPQLLKRCLAAVRAAGGSLAVNTFVVDNASRDLNLASVEALLPGVQVVANERNVGFAVAANQGLRLATGRYLLLINADTLLAPDTLSAMVAYMDEHADVGCATARLVMEDGRLDLACRRSFPTPVRSFYRLTLLSRLFPRSRRFGQYNLTYLDEHVEAEIDSPCGAFMFVRQEVIEQVGLLDERYFMYGEDLDWAYRMKAAGWRIMYTPITTVIHLKRASSRKSRSRTIRAFYDAMRIFYREHYERSYPRWLSWIIYRAIDVREALELTANRLVSRGAQS
jgi:N-acetylglucosaminyl-diphospho-decaprenol L-rhamnosyltransferase